MFNETLRKTREEKNISQVQMAKLLKIPVSTYRNYENTLRQPGFDLLVKMSSILEVSIDHLLENKTPDGIYGDILFKIKLLPSDYIVYISDYVDYLFFKKNKNT